MGNYNEVLDQSIDREIGRKDTPPNKDAEHFREFVERLDLTNF